MRTTRSLIFVAGAIALVFAAACATFSGNAADRKEIQVLLGQWREALLTEDVDKVMALYAEQPQPGLRDRAAEAKFLKEEFADGLVDDAMIIYEHATIEVTGDRAAVVPIAISKPTGSGSLGLKLVRENGHWRIAGIAS